MKILWICFVWPEPDSSAAGFRTLELINILRHAGHEVRACSPCQPNLYKESLEKTGIGAEHLLPNDSAFDFYLDQYQPDVVFFDRFVIEEQFSWRVKSRCPNALRILDSVDLHSLRRARQRKIEKFQSALELDSDDLQSDDAIREVSAIYRCDLSLIISDFEVSLLKNHYKIPEELISLCRFSYPAPSKRAEFNQRRNFVAIGNFNHAPNLDSFRLLHDQLWPKIKERLKQSAVEAELHIYGAYVKSDFMALDNKATGFRVLGKAEDAREMIAKYRVNLAPLRFGAGIKGKISDAWSVGTPCIATSIAAEGMTGGLPFGGSISDDWDKFVEQACELYLNSSSWEQAQKKGIDIINAIFNLESNSNGFLSSIESSFNKLEDSRRRNFMGQILWYQQHRSTEYFSRWIEVKNQLLKN